MRRLLACLGLSLLAACLPAASCAAQAQATPRFGEQRLTVRDGASAQDKRRQLVAFLWGADRPPAPAFRVEPGEGSGPDLAAYQDAAEVKRMTVSLDYGLRSKLLHYVPKKPIGKAIIFHQGHSPDPGRHVVEFFLQAGLDVLTISMPFYRPNSQVSLYHPRFGILRLWNHEHFKILETLDGRRHPIRLFIEPVLAGINYLDLNGHDRVYMIGLSGGAWTTTLAAAIDERIVRSYAVSGPRPHWAIRHVARGLGDYENSNFHLLDVATVEEQYVLGSLGEGRGQIQVVLKFDLKASEYQEHKLYESRVADAVRQAGDGYFAIDFDESADRHDVTEWALRRALADMRAPRSYDGDESTEPDRDAAPLNAIGLTPSRTVAGQVFNRQPDGEAAVGVEAQGLTPESIIVWNGIHLSTAVSHDLSSATANVPAELYRTPGRYEVHVEDYARRKRSQSLYFVVEPRAEGHEDPAILAVFPREANAGQAFNRQPDGSSALAVTAAGLTATTVVRWEGMALPSTVSGDRSTISAVVPSDFLRKPGRFRIVLADEARKMESPAFEFVVRDERTGASPPRSTAERETSVVSSAPLPARYAVNGADGWFSSEPVGDVAPVVAAARRQIFRTFPVPARAERLAAKIEVTGSVRPAVFLFDVIWRASGAEVGRKVLTVPIEVGGPVHASFEEVRPSNADEMLLIARPWREQDGDVVIGAGTLEWKAGR